MDGFAEQESGLPYTPSHTGRRSRVGYLGFEGVGFNDLWPLFGGLVGSFALAIAFFLGGAWPRGGWEAKTAVAALPFAAGFAWLRYFVAGRPPHFRGDLWATALSLRVDFGDPPFRAFPLIPRIRADLATATGPERARARRHPLARAR